MELNSRKRRRPCAPRIPEDPQGLRTESLPFPGKDAWVKRGVGTRSPAGLRNCRAWAHAKAGE
jgi:hypothetical protein